MSAVAGVAADEAGRRSGPTERADGAGGRRNHPSPTVLSFVSPNAIAVVSMTYARTPARPYTRTHVDARTHARTHARPHARTWTHARTHTHGHSNIHI